MEMQDKLRLNAFIPTMDYFQTNLKRRGEVYFPKTVVSFKYGQPDKQLRINTNILIT